MITTESYLWLRVCSATWLRQPPPPILQALATLQLDKHLLMRPSADKLLAAGGPHFADSRPKEPVPTGADLACLATLQPVHLGNHPRE